MMAGYDSSTTISWKELREAENLTDTNYIDNIFDNISTEKNKHRRGYMYFIMYRICATNFYQKGLAFLIERIEKETDKYNISAILDGIMDLPKSTETDLAKIIECLSHKTWLVRYSATNT